MERDRPLTAKDAALNAAGLQKPPTERRQIERQIIASTLRLTGADTAPSETRADSLDGAGEETLGGPESVEFGEHIAPLVPDPADLGPQSRSTVVDSLAEYDSTNDAGSLPADGAIVNDLGAAVSGIDASDAARPGFEPAGVTAIDATTLLDGSDRASADATNDRPSEPVSNAAAEIGPAAAFSPAPTQETLAPWAPVGDESVDSGPFGGHDLPRSDDAAAGLSALSDITDPEAASPPSGQYAFSPPAGGEFHTQVVGTPALPDDSRVDIGLPLAVILQYRADERDIQEAARLVAEEINRTTDEKVESKLNEREHRRRAAMRAVYGRR